MKYRDFTNNPMSMARINQAARMRGPVMDADYVIPGEYRYKGYDDNSSGLIRCVLALLFLGGVIFALASCS